MIKVLVRLDFFYDDEDAIDHFILMVKSGTSFDAVEEELLKAHKYLLSHLNYDDNSLEDLKCNFL